MAICRRAGYRQFVSYRSAETEDHLIADLAVGTGCGHLKLPISSGRHVYRASWRSRSARSTLSDNRTMIGVRIWREPVYLSIG